uniref:Tail fiber assembly protein from lambdoid prophage e14 n=1 Tax=Arsenophonus endosymbiont of Trialeurodes vaporariorum TaxID=235567 RepID=A0A3B0MKW6_9GAMM
MKYTVDIAQPNFDKNGFATQSGWLQIYQYAYDATGEYTGTTYEYVIKDMGLSAGSTLAAPIIPADDKAIVRSEDSKTWEYPADHRGKPIFNAETQAALIVDYIGEIKAGFTLIELKTPFDKWDGKKWVTDKKAQKEQAVRLAESQKKALISEAETEITLLERKSRLAMASDEEKAIVNAWEIYSVQLSEVNTETAPNINWPEKPQ